MNKIKFRNFEIIKSNIPKTSEFKFCKPFQEIQPRNMNEKELNEETFKTRHRRIYRKTRRTKRTSNLKIRKKSFGDNKQFFSPRSYQFNNFGNLNIHRKKHRINHTKAKKSKKLNYLKLANKNNYLSSSKKLAKYLYKNALYSSSKISNSIEATLLCTESEKKYFLKYHHSQNSKIPPCSRESIECKKNFGVIIGNEKQCKNDILESQYLCNKTLKSKNSKVDWEGVLHDLPNIVPKLLNSKNTINTVRNRDLHSRSVDQNSKVAQKNSLNFKLTKIKELNSLKTEVKDLNDTKPAEKKCLSENDVRKSADDEKKSKVKKMIANTIETKLQKSPSEKLPKNANTTDTNLEKSSSEKLPKNANTTETNLENSSSEKLPKNAAPIKKNSRLDHIQKKIIATDTKPKLSTIQDKKKLTLNGQTEAKKTTKKDSIGQTDAKKTTKKDSTSVTTPARTTDIAKSYISYKNVTKSAPLPAKSEKKEIHNKNSMVSRFRSINCNKPATDVIKPSSRYNRDQTKINQVNPVESHLEKLNMPNVTPVELKTAYSTEQKTNQSLHLINDKSICNLSPKKIGSLTKVDLQIYALKIMEKATRKKIEENKNLRNSEKLNVRKKMNIHDINDSEAQKSNVHANKVEVPHKVFQQIDARTKIKQDSFWKRNKVETISSKQTKNAPLLKDKKLVFNTPQTTTNLRKSTIHRLEKSSNLIDQKIKELKPEHTMLNNYKVEKEKLSGSAMQEKQNLKRNSKVENRLLNKNNEQNQSIKIYVGSIPSLRLKKLETNPNQINSKNIGKKHDPLSSIEKSKNLNLETYLPPKAIITNESFQNDHKDNRNNKLTPEIKADFSINNENQVEIIISSTDNSLKLPKSCIEASDNFMTDSKSNDSIEINIRLKKNYSFIKNTISSGNNRSIEAVKNEETNNDDKKLLTETNETILEVPSSYLGKNDKFPIENVISIVNNDTEPANKKITPELYAESKINTANDNFDDLKKNNVFLKDNDHVTDEKNELLYMGNDKTNLGRKKSIEFNNSFLRLDLEPADSCHVEEALSDSHIQTREQISSSVGDSKKMDVPHLKEIDVKSKNDPCTCIWIYKPKTRNSDLKFQIADIEQPESLNKASNHLDEQNNGLIEVETEIIPKSLDSLIDNALSSNTQELTKEHTISENINTENQVLNTVLELQGNFCRKTLRPNVCHKIFNSKLLEENYRTFSESIINMPQFRTLSEPQIKSSNINKYNLNKMKLRHERINTYKKNPEDVINQNHCYDKSDATSQTSNTRICSSTKAEYTQYDLNQQITTDCDLFPISDIENLQRLDTDYYSDSSTSANYEYSARSHQSDNFDNVIECFEDSETFVAPPVPVFKGCACMKSRYERLCRIAYGNLS